MADNAQENIVDQRAGSAGGEKELADSFVVKTSRFGELSVDADKVITMTSPILGFPESKRFMIRPHGPESPFLWFQSMDNPDLAFVIVPANMVASNYQPEIGAEDRQELGFDTGPGPELMIILTLFREGSPKITANLLAPLALNVERRLAKQLLLDPAKYDIAFPVEE